MIRTVTSEPGSRCRVVRKTSASETSDQKDYGMNSRTTPMSVAGRGVATRRLRRRSASANRPYCSTNGCTSYLIVDQTSGTAHCEICGLTRRLH
jgi:hypothetical protein